VPVHASAVGRETRGHTGPAGEGVCVEFPSGAVAEVSVDDPSLSTGVAVLDGGAASASCGGSGCVDVTLSARPAGCLRGRVLQLDGGVAGGVAIRATTGEAMRSRGALVVTAADGTFCARAPAGAPTRLSVREPLDGGLFAVASTTATAAGPGVCGATCTDVGDLQLTSSTGRLCVKGRIWDGDAGWPRVPAPVGTPIWVIDEGESRRYISPGCQAVPYSNDPPTTTLPEVLVATGATDVNGRFCVDFSPTPPQSPQPDSPPAPHFFEFIPGDCNLRRRAWSQTASWYWDACGFDWIGPLESYGFWQEAPTDLDRTCEQANCVDIGDFDYGYLYSGSGCNRFAW
jgi:hypothetical protein